jgi:hypothetical protein
MNDNVFINPQPQLVKRFYFLDYFFILLECCYKYSDKEKVFDYFKELKIVNQLGESKYKKLTQEDENLSRKQIGRFNYSFQQVIIESISYGLVKEEKSKILLTELGKECLILGQKNKRDFNLKIFKLMEQQFYAFYQLINHCYLQNTTKNGLLIFPIYSPLKLGFDKSKITHNEHVFQYSKVLRITLEKDTIKYLNKKHDLIFPENILINQLINDGLITQNKIEKFDVSKFYSLVRRIRTYWLNYFLKSIYNYPYSFDAFNIWVERGKQIGLIHTTDFYPDFDGRYVFPTSIIVEKTLNIDFVEAFRYPTNEKIFIHRPDWEKVGLSNRKVNQDEFIKHLVEAYFDLKKSRRTHFIRLGDLREKVCFRMRIPSYHFNECLEKTYLMNIRGEMDAQISLEADRLPHETNAMYLKREPVLVNGKYKNIIAIDYKKIKK